jgi:type IV pilus biogenesis protein CpaD/CtpE
MMERSVREEPGPGSSELDEVVQRIEIPGGSDPQTIEALQLEIRRLARRSGLEVKRFRVESSEGKSSLE